MADSVMLPDGVTSSQVARYSRQMLVGDMGGGGQAKVCRARVLVVGAGGLGSSVLPCLAGAGVGALGIIDPDTVDASNLHRQFLHREVDAGIASKASSAARFVSDLNSGVTTEVYAEALDAGNALELVSAYDVVVDASDNPRTRYLLSDACVLAGRPLVSGSAIGLEGQLTVYNFRGGPCYRCAYPNPPKAAASCSESGVLGPVPAVIGNLQALEVLKIVAGFGEVLSGILVMYDARSCTFHRFKVPKRPLCVACGPDPSIDSMVASGLFCTANSLRGVASGGCAVSPPPLRAGPIADRPTGPCTSPIADVGGGGSVSVGEYQSVRSAGTAHVLVDVRDRTQFGMCALAGAINIPLTELGDRLHEVAAAAEATGSAPQNVLVFVICRKGVASQAGAAALLGSFPGVASVRGGYTAWASVDPQFPSY